MTQIFNTSPGTWTYTAEVPAVLYSTQLPVPAVTASNRQQERRPGQLALARPIRTAEYWERVMEDQNFEVEDDLDTDDFNLALWTGLRGDGVRYPETRHGRDMRRDRKRLLIQYVETER
jgi:hypothetical protein